MGSEFGKGIELGRRELDIDQIEGLAEVDDERIFALADEDAADAAAAWDLDIPDVLIGVRDIVGNRLVADVVDWLVEGCRAAFGRVEHRCRRAGAAWSVDDAKRVRLVHVQRRRVRRRYVAGA